MGLKNVCLLELHFLDKIEPGSSVGGQRLGNQVNGSLAFHEKWLAESVLLRSSEWVMETSRRPKAHL